MGYPGTFDARADEWAHYLSTPWARVRYDVVARVLDETIQSLRLDRADNGQFELPRSSATCRGSSATCRGSRDQLPRIAGG